MHHFFKYKTVSKSLKNLLIFFPIIFSNKNIVIDDLIILISGFLIFYILTNLIYLINDYTDRKKDKKNSLKDQKNIGYNLTKKNFYLINSSIFLLGIVIFYIGLFNKYIFLYVVNFYLYNFILKRVKFLDIISLNFFYIARLAYGAELAEVELSIMFLTFFSSLFVVLSLLKRVIQVNVNKLKKKNEIIAYFSKDIFYLKVIILFFLIINFISITYFFISPVTFSSTSTNFDNINIFLIFICVLYYLNFIRLINLVFTNIIKIDIFNFVAKDKIILISTVICLTLIVIIK